MMDTCEYCKLPIRQVKWGHWAHSATILQVIQSSQKEGFPVSHNSWPIHDFERKVK